MKDPESLQLKLSKSILDRCELQRPPDMARLVFAVPLHTNKGDDILNALQQVYISLRSLNLPVLRFHTDRSREFFNRKTRAWFHERGVRTTTTEGDATAKRFR